MKRDLVSNKKISSSFLSCEKDIETILKKLFIENQPYSDILKRLLVVDTKDCLENNSDEVLKLLKNVSLSYLRKNQYIRLEPIIKMVEHEPVKAYIYISFDNFTPNEENDYYRDHFVTFDIICNTEYWDIGNYRLRPIKIAGYIDGILNNAKLSGIGTFNFISFSQVILNERLSGYSLTYRAVHGNDDNLEPKTR